MRACWCIDKAKPASSRYSSPVTKVGKHFFKFDTSAHDISLVGMIGDWMLEFKAIGMTVPLFLLARTALAAEIADKKAKEPTDVTARPAAANDGNA